MSHYSARYYDREKADCNLIHLHEYSKFFYCLTGFVGLEAVPEFNDIPVAIGEPDAALTPTTVVPTPRNVTSDGVGA